MKTYDCPNDGIPKPERRQHERPDSDQMAQDLFNGFTNVIGNLDTNPYLQGYVTAMRKSFAEYQRAQAMRIAGLEHQIAEHHEWRNMAFLAHPNIDADIEALETTTPVKSPDGSLRQFTLNFAGKRYWCICGCNVFHKPDDRNLNLYRCNSCGEQFEAS